MSVRPRHTILCSPLTFPARPPIPNLDYRTQAISGVYSASQLTSDNQSTEKLHSLTTFFIYQSSSFSHFFASELFMLVDRDYIFTLYSMGVGAIFRYFRQLEQRIEDAEARAAHSFDVKATRLAEELASTKRTLARKSQQLFIAAVS